MFDQEDEPDTRAAELGLMAPDDDNEVIHISTSDMPAPPSPVEDKSYYFGSTSAKKRKAPPSLDSEDDSSDFKLDSEAEESDAGEWGFPSDGSGLIAAKQRHEKKRKTFLPPRAKKKTAAPAPRTLADEIDALAGVVRDSPPAYIPGDANANGEIPAPPEIFDWTAIDNAEPAINPHGDDWCVLCKVTQRSIDIDPENTYYKDLLEYAEKNWLVQSPGDMGTELQRQYNDNLRFYIEPEDMQLPCRKYIFWYHFVGHVSVPLIDASINNNIIQEMITVTAREQLFVLDPLTKRKKVTSNTKTLGIFFKLLDKKEKLTKQIEALKPRAVL
jgi:hypothetical protein